MTMDNVNIQAESFSFSILEKNRKAILVLLFFLFFVELLRTAWISDDIKLTLRTVLNFIHGYGPRFNIDERVQVYTHPLWFFALSGVTFVVRNIYLATFLLSISISLTAFGLFMSKFSKNMLGVIIFSAALLLSKAFVDFSTSGLENPLSYLLIIFLVLAAKKAMMENARFSILGYFFCCSLLYLCRPDLIILAFPLTLLVCVENKKRYNVVIGSFLIGALPAILWTLFSLYYYGFPFPNTAYAKLSTGIPFEQRVEQGLLYLLDSINRDPLTLGVILLGIGIGVRKDVFSFCLSVGLVLYILYIIVIGGDFMTGRFLAVPFFLAAIQCMYTNFNRAQLAIIAVGIAALSLMTFSSTWLSNANYSDKAISKNGIADERGFYFKKMGLVNADRIMFSEPDWSLSAPFTVISVACGGMGGGALRYGPSGHFIDDCALADPFLSHIEENSNEKWRAGHFYRTLPENYLKSIELNTNLLTDPTLHTYYDSIRKITRGELNDPSRWIEIMRINFSSQKK